MIRLMRRLSMLTFAGLGACYPAFGAEHIIEEVIVTAERREANLQEVPLAVSSFTSDQLDAMQVETIGDLQSMVPNLTIHVGDANNVVAYMRGIGQIDSIAFFEPGVGIYLDDVYLGRAQGAFLDVVDVATYHASGPTISHKGISWNPLIYRTRLEFGFWPGHVSPFTII